MAAMPTPCREGLRLPHGAAIALTLGRMRSELRYTYLAFELTHLLDGGVVVDIDETRERLDDGTALDWLEERFAGEPHHFDPSLYSPEEREIVVRSLANVALAVNARKKFGVEKNGIALLLACAIQVIQGGPEEYEQEQ